MFDAIKMHELIKLNW